MCEGRECVENIYTALCFVVYLKLLNKVKYYKSKKFFLNDKLLSDAQIIREFFVFLYHHFLAQGLAVYTVFVNKVVLEHSHSHLLL